MASNICLKTFRTACAVMAVAATAFAYDQGFPDGYAPLDWIESTGGQYIDTGVDAGANTTIDMSFGHSVYGNSRTLFGKDVWDPQGFLFVLQNGKFRFFGAKEKEPGEAWNLIAKDETEERDYRFTLGADNTARRQGTVRARDRPIHRLAPHAVALQVRQPALRLRGVPSLRDEDRHGFG